MLADESTAAQDTAAPWRDVLIEDDALAALRRLPDAVADALVTDPPAGIGFMGKEWDHHRGGRAAWVAWLRDVLAEARRATKPGGHALVWALPRTSHWTGMALEDAGWEVRDCVYHICGQGYPKSHNLRGEHVGWGTALKPAVEVWWLCRKPLAEPTVARQVLATGTGALHVDACRVEGVVPSVPQPAYKSTTGLVYRMQTGRGRNGERSHAPGGRWPPHLLLSHSLWCGPAGCAPGCPVATLDAQSGTRAGGRRPAHRGRSFMGTFAGDDDAPARDYDGGGASRFFPTFAPDPDAPPFLYAGKASRAERNAGCDGLPRRFVATLNAGVGNREHAAEEPTAWRGNHHPTVKPLALMRWLVRLVTPPGGLVLDPFLGSGTTALACVAEGAHFLGVEREAEYAAIARARLAASPRRTQKPRPHPPAPVTVAEEGAGPLRPRTRRPPGARGRP